MLQRLLVVTLLLFGHSLPSPAAEIFTSAEVVASSEPVPVSDMISGWDGPFKPGEYAYADGRFRIGAEVDGWRIEREQRWYYYFTFSKETSRFYNSLERGGQVLRSQVDIDAKSFTALGIRLAKQFNFERWSITPAVIVYSVRSFQFGTLKGGSEGGGDLRASAVLDYYFDDDKILEFNADADKGQAVSVDISGHVDLTEHWRLSAQISDFYNRVQLDKAAFTKGCVNFGSPLTPVCNSDTVGEGRSGHEEYITDIPMTVAARVEHAGLGVSGSLYWHDRYQRIGVKKHWQTLIGALGVSGYSTRQLGLHWHSQWHTLDIVSDETKAVKVRDADIRLGLRYRW